MHLRPPPVTGAVTATTSYTFRNPGDGLTSTQVETAAVNLGDYRDNYTYSYDANGNITSIVLDGRTTTYVYDSLNQLVRENNESAGKTWVWTYDTGGNILSKTEYAYTTGELGEVVSTNAYAYTDANWGDLLTAYNGVAITHDEIGNPLNDGTWTYTWSGRQLTSMTDGTTTWSYKYNADGLRTEKTNGTTTYKYVYSGSTLVQMSVGDDVLNFYYDNGTPVSLTYNGSTYYYITNLQGDVVAIVSQTGRTLATYTYDAWGNPLSVNSYFITGLAEMNPLRYRGYVYDSECHLYYLQSRYYDPSIGRFLNVDAYASTGQGIIGHNMFAYCLNNPVCLVDSNGNEPTEAVDCDGDGEVDYYKYEYTFTYVVYLSDSRNLGRVAPYEVTGTGTVFIFPETNKDFFENPSNIPDDFDALTDLLVADIPDVDNITFYAYQAQRLDFKRSAGVAEALKQYDNDFSRGFNRSVESIVTEWYWHLFFGGAFGYPRTANIDFDRDSEKKVGRDYLNQVIEEIFLQ